MAEAEAEIAKLERASVNLAPTQKPFFEQNNIGPVRDQLAQAKVLLSGLEANIDKARSPVADIDDAAVRRATVAGSKIPEALKAGLLKGMDEAELQKVQDAMIVEPDPAKFEKLRARYEVLYKQLGKDIGQLAPGISAGLDSALKAAAQETLSFDQGAEDDAGNRVSIEKRAQIDIDTLDRNFAHDKKQRIQAVADLQRQTSDAQSADLVKIAELEANIYKTKKDADKAVQDVVNSGEAMRQQSVSKIKADKIKDIREAADKQTAADNNEINNLRVQIKERNDAYVIRIAEMDYEAAKAQTDHDNAISRIKAETLVKTNAHNQRMTELNAEVKLQGDLTGSTQAELSALQSIANLRAGQSAGYASGGGSSGSSTGAVSNEAALAAYNNGGHQAGVQASIDSYAANFANTYATNYTGMFAGYADGGMSITPQLAHVSETGEPELHIPPGVTRLLLNAAGQGGSGGGDLHIHIGSFTGTQDNIRQLSREIVRQQTGAQRLRGNTWN